MALDHTTTTWLYCLMHPTGSVAGKGANAPIYPIDDNLVEVPSALANELVLQPVFRNDFAGRYVIPSHAYRHATEAEVSALLAKREAATAEQTTGKSKKAALEHPAPPTLTEAAAPTA